MEGRGGGGETIVGGCRGGVVGDGDVDGGGGLVGVVAGLVRWAGHVGV